MYLIKYILCISHGKSTVWLKELKSRGGGNPGKGRSTVGKRGGGVKGLEQGVF